MPVVMKITGQGHCNTHAIKVLTDGRDFFRGLRSVDGDSYNFRASEGKFFDLDGCSDSIGSVSVCH